MKVEKILNSKKKNKNSLNVKKKRKEKFWNKEKLKNFFTVPFITNSSEFKKIKEF